jgi:hypothetical protein
VANANFTPGPQTGTTEKDGYTTLSFSFGDNTTNIVMKGGKVAVKTDDGWHSGDELTADAGGGGGGPNMGMFAARMAQAFKAPADQFKDQTANLQNVQQTADGYTADLSDDDAKKALSAMRGRRGGGGGGGGGGGTPPAVTITNPKVSLHIWVTDGTVSKFEVHMTGTRAVEGQDPQDVDRTATTEIKDVGTAKADVPDEAKAKLGA